ncbi:hypothetical protein [Leifsonia poae]|uniref:hypothetical protein n=1 Tax=Leifsonia poae TaxID=110933 RepID=UPI003D671980
MPSRHIVPAIRPLTAYSAALTTALVVFAVLVLAGAGMPSCVFWGALALASGLLAVSMLRVMRLGGTGAASKE